MNKAFGVILAVVKFVMMPFRLWFLKDDQDAHDD